jgi:hypothetical protein
LSVVLTALAFGLVLSGPAPRKATLLGILFGALGLLGRLQLGM